MYVHKIVDQRASSLGCYLYNHPNACTYAWGGGGGLWDGISKCNIIVKSLLNNDCILLYIINIIYCYIRAPANTTLINISSYLIVRPIMKALRSA